MNNLKALRFLIAALVAMPVTSYAQQLAYTSKNVKLRAGPSSEYPIVTIVPGGVPLTVEGCLSDYRWCDVVAGPDRGWVFAGNIVYAYQGVNVPLLTYGAVIGIGILAFNRDHYWDENYRARSWYPQRHHWIDRRGPGFGPGARRVPPPGAGFRPGMGRGSAQGQRPGAFHGSPIAGPGVGHPAQLQRQGADQRPARAHGPGNERHTSGQGPAGVQDR